MFPNYNCDYMSEKYPLIKVDLEQGEKNFVSEEVYDFLIDCKMSGLYNEDGELQYIWLPTDKDSIKEIINSAKEKFEDKPKFIGEVKNFVEKNLKPKEDERVVLFSL